MSTKTTNYELIKPSLVDPADITAINPNWDKIDTTLKAKADLTNGKIPSSQLDLSSKVNKTGDELTGALDFKNTDQFKAISKTRVINTNEYYVSLGCGIIGGEGVIAMEARLQPPTSGSSSILGRLEIGSRGVAFTDASNKRTQLYSSGLVDASVES